MNTQKNLLAARVELQLLNGQGNLLDLNFHGRIEIGLKILPY